MNYENNEITRLYQLSKTSVKQISITNPYQKGKLLGDFLNREIPVNYGTKTDE